MWPSRRTHLSKQTTCSDLRSNHTTRIAVGISTCWWRSLVVAISKFNHLTISQHSATRKHHSKQNSHILKVTGWVWESLKKYKLTLITVTTSIYLLDPVLVDLTVESDSILTNPIGKMGCKAGRCCKACTL